MTLNPEISAGHLHHLFGVSQNEIAASRAYGNINNQRPRQKIGDLPDHLEGGCIGMSAGHEKSISRAIGLWRIPGRRLQKMVWTDIPMQLR